MAEPSDLTSSVFAALRKLQINVPKSPLNQQNSNIKEQPNQERTNVDQSTAFKNYVPKAVNDTISNFSGDRTAETNRPLYSHNSRNAFGNKSTCTTIHSQKNSNFKKRLDQENTNHDQNNIFNNNFSGAAKHTIPYQSRATTVHTNRSLYSRITNVNNSTIKSQRFRTKLHHVRNFTVLEPCETNNTSQLAFNQFSRHTVKDENYRELENDDRSVHDSGEVSKQGKINFRFYFKELEDLVSQESLQIAIELANTFNGFHDLLEEESFLLERPDWIILITQLLVKVCQCDYLENKIKVLNIVCDSNFINIVAEFLIKVPQYYNSEKQLTIIRNLNTFLGDVILLLENLVNIFQKNSKELFHEPIMKMFGNISSIEQFTNINVDDIIKEKFKRLENRLKKIESPWYNRWDKKFIDEGLPPDDFRTLDLYPGQHEILLDGQVFLRRCIVEGSYNDVEHYLDVQFRLLRQDFVAPLREGFKEILQSLKDGNYKNKRISNVRLFNHCSFERPVMVYGKVSDFLCFDTKKKMKVRWEYNRWFMFGSLLFFSFDNFSSFFLGTVVNKDSEICEKYRTISVKLLDKELTDEDYSKELIMVESTIFYQPYYHVMKALKKFNRRNFPMARYIVEVNPVIKPPSYMQRSKYLRIHDKYFDVFNDFQWPTPDDLGFDDHQFGAFKSALTQEFAIIQGPPGTGKTYLGLKIIKTLLKNHCVHERLGAPILVVCYTNHALDQFLEGILKFNHSIVRVGSQTKSELIKHYELNIVRRRFFRKEERSEYQRLRENRNFLQTFQKENISYLDTILGIVDFEILKPLMSNCHKNQLKSVDNFVAWLLGSNVIISGAKEDLSFENDNSSTKNDAENESDVDSEEEETRKQFKTDYCTPLLDVNLKTMHCVTVDSLQKTLEKVENEGSEIENSYIFDDISEYDYVRMRWRIETKIEGLVRDITSLKQQFKTNYNKMEKENVYKLKSNLMQMSMKERWNLYWQWVKALRSLYINEYEMSEIRYKQAIEFLDIEILKNYAILGTTTTKAAEYHNMFKTLKPKVVIVEEAAEVLESHIVTSLTSHCEHLILIGDHQQLRPSPTVYELAKKYNLEISLFERMIKNNLSFSSLRAQHRMRPEICDLITPTIYPNLENHTSVFNYESIKGVSKNLFFITHSEYEEMDNQMESHMNPHEGDFVLKLAEYLLCQGYSSEQITILVTYSGQLIYLKMKKQNLKLEEMTNIRITTVDNYQGEESEIILLSLVRSNADNKIGFLATPNRVCVALSRAKHGLYIIGNMNCLEKGSQIWPEIKGQLKMHDAIGPELQLECQVHKNKTMVSSKNDFLKVSEGGCTVLCNSLLQCGHFCKSLCHPDDRDHKQYECPEQCTKLCPDGHPCLNQCYKICSCQVLVTQKLNCGHSKDLFCHIDANSYPCKKKVTVEVPLCGHIVEVDCYKTTDGSKVQCTKPCAYRGSCGHACSRICHLDTDPNHIYFTCDKPCERMNKGCTLEHYCGKRCFEECSMCNEKVKKVLPCGHEKTVPCHTNKNMVKCDVLCSRLLPCNHKCKKLCKDPCGEVCNEVVEKTIDSCGHKVKILCSVNPKSEDCHELCRNELSCGHPCSKLCRHPCRSEDCVVIVDCGFESICGHPAKVKCKDRGLSREKLTSLALESCPNPCQEQLLCTHLCVGTCSGCKQGRLHEICKEKCARVKICGHSCNIDCSDICPPCKQPCLSKCRHSVCPHLCGDKCNPCSKKCPWQCPHKKCNKKCSQICDRARCYEPCSESLPCGHECIGFCCEPCPDKCRVCNKDEVTEIFFGNEDKEDARFVVLEDCGHFFESESIEYYLGVKKDTSKSNQPDTEIIMKTCPKCKTPIVSTLRFMSTIRKVMGDINQVKKKQNIMRPPLRPMQTTALRKLEDLKNFNETEVEKKMTMENSKYFLDIIDRISSNIAVMKKENVMILTNYLSDTQMYLYVFIIKILENIKTRVLLLPTLNETSSCELLPKMDEILCYVTHIIPYQKISQQLQFDLCCEVERFYAFANLLQLKITFKISFDTSSSSLKNSYESCVREIQCLDKFDKTRNANVYKLLEDFKLKAETAEDIKLKAEIETKEDFKLKAETEEDIILKAEIETKEDFKLKAETEEDIKLKAEIETKEDFKLKAETEEDIKLKAEIETKEDFKLKAETEEDIKLKAEIETKEDLKFKTKAEEDIKLKTETETEENFKLKAETTSVCTKEYQMIFLGMKKDSYSGHEQSHFFKCPNGHMYCVTECGDVMQMAKCPVIACNAIISGTNH